MAVGVLLGAWAGIETPVADAYTTPAPGQFQGVYRLANEAPKKAEVRRIVDAATDEMPLFRGLARERLYQRTEPMAVLVIGFPPDRISVGYLGEKAVVSPLDGTKIKWSSRFGDKTIVTQTFERGRIVQRYKGPMDSRRKSVYSLSADGARLTVETTVDVDLLPKPVHYRVHYVRK